MKNRVWLIALVVLLALAFPLAAFADSPHWISGSGALDGSSLRASFMEAGLGNNQGVDYVASAVSTATWYCINHKGYNPNAANKTVYGVSAPGHAFADSNGNVKAEIELPVLPPHSAPPTCPNGQDLVFGGVTFSKLVIEDTTNKIDPLSILGEWSMVAFVPAH